MLGSDPEEYKQYNKDPNALNVQGPQSQYATTQMQGAQNRAAPQAGQAVTGQASQLSNEQDQFRNRQLGLADLLNSSAQGQGPSASAMAADRAREALAADTMSMQAGRRGASSAAGALGAQRAVVQGNQGIAAQEAQGRAQEMQAAQGALGSVLGQGRGSDISFAGQNATLGQGMTLANMAARNQRAEYDANLRFQQGQQNDTYALGNAQLLSTEQQAALQARLEQERLAAGQLSQGTPGILGPLIGGGAQVGAALIKASDVNSKSGARKWTKAERQQYLGEQILGGLTGAAGTYFAQKATDKQEAKDKAEEEKSKREEDERFYRRYEEIYGEPHPDSPEAIHRQASAAADRTSSTTIDERGAEQLRLQAEEAERQRLAAEERKRLLYNPYGTVMSDDESKTEKRKAHRMLDALTPYTYEYKDDARAAGMPGGKQAGVMAQDLEKTEGGRGMLAGRDPQTGYKMVDYGKGLPTMMAGLADINDRLSKLEGRKTKKSKKGR